MTYTSATNLIIIINGAAAPFRVLVPLFSDRFGPLNIITPVTLVWAAVAFCWLGVSSTGGYYAFAAVYGATSGAFQCLLPTTVASITDRLDKVGTRMGMSFALISFSSMTGPPVGGALQSADGGGFTGAQVWAACATVLGFVLCFAARWARAGFDPRAKC